MKTVKLLIKYILCVIFSFYIISTLFTGCSANREWAITSFNSSSLYSTDFVYHDGMVYYWSGDFFQKGIYSCDTNTGETRMCITFPDDEDVGGYSDYGGVKPYLNYLNGYLYYVFNNTIYVYDCESEEIKKLFVLDAHSIEDTSISLEDVEDSYGISFLYVNSDYLVFACDFAVFKLNLNGSSPKVIFNSLEQADQYIDCITANENKLTVTYTISDFDSIISQPAIKNAFIDTDSGDVELRYNDDMLAEYNCYFFGDYEIRQNFFTAEKLGIFYNGEKIGEFGDSGDNMMLNVCNNEFYYFDSDTGYNTFYKVNEQGSRATVFALDDFNDFISLQSDGIAVCTSYPDYTNPDYANNADKREFKIYDLKNYS